MHRTSIDDQQVNTLQDDCTANASSIVDSQRSLPRSSLPRTFAVENFVRKLEESSVAAMQRTAQNEYSRSAQKVLHRPTQSMEHSLLGDDVLGRTTFCERTPSSEHLYAQTGMHRTAQTGGKATARGMHEVHRPVVGGLFNTAQNSIHPTQRTVLNTCSQKIPMMHRLVCTELFDQLRTGHLRQVMIAYLHQF
jgi:hypothetical protein